MLPEISIAPILLTSLVLVVTLVMFRFFILPYFGILYYQKQGVTPLFHWKLISLIDGWKNAKQKGDFFHVYKQAIKKNPQTKVFAENLLSRVNLFVVDPEMIKDLLKKYDVYHKDLSLTGLLNELGSGNIGQAEDSAWKKRRKILASAFNFESLKDTIPMIIEVTQERFNQWIKSSELKDQNLVEQFTMITGQVTGRFMFGQKFGQKTMGGVPLTIAIKRLVADISEEIISPYSLLLGTKVVHANILPRHRKLNSAISEFRGICKEMIQETGKSESKERSFISILLSLGSGENSEDYITDEDITGEFVGFFVAGTDTTAHLVASALYFLWKNPDCLKRLREEVDREFADVSKLNIDNLNRMDYAVAVLKESLRLGGPVANLFGRVAMQDDDLCGLKVKKGTLVNALFDVLFTSEKYFSNPKEFAPERWLDNTPYDNDGFKKEPYAFTPFSAGPRNCLGQHLAMIEARIILALFIKTFDFSFSKDYKFVLTVRFVYETLDPLLATLKPKHQ